jgi:hypothetical protein
MSAFARLCFKRSRGGYIIAYSDVIISQVAIAKKTVGTACSKNQRETTDYIYEEEETHIFFSPFKGIRALMGPLQVPFLRRSYNEVYLSIFFLNLFLILRNLS